jgi:hypothetical protein
MGLFDHLKSASRATLPSGSFTVDRQGAILASTISSRFPADTLLTISGVVMRAFAEGRQTGMPLAEINVRFGALTLRAVEMRGGAMIFLSPRGEQANRLQSKR